MKKIKMLCLVFCLSILLFAMSTPCYANSSECKSMVYVSGEQADGLYELLQKESYDLYKGLKFDSLTVVKESITPIYTIDLLDYARTGELKIVPLWKSHTGLSGNGKGNAYIAKTITADGKYGGNIMFYVENGVAYNMLYTPSEYSPSWPDDGAGHQYPASASYADHASRIANILCEKDLISAYDVKYVIIDRVGEFFYIDNDKHGTLVSIGMISTDKSNQSSDAVDCHIGTGDELLTLAKKQLAQYETFLKEKAEWEAANPGKTWDRVGGYSVPPIISECSQVDNIVDIAAYLDIDYSLSSNPDFIGGIADGNVINNDNNSISDETDASCDPTIIVIVTSIATIALLTVAITVWMNKRNKQRPKP